MALLQSILAELGLEKPATLDRSTLEEQPHWVTGHKFVPVEGASYELAFARIPANEEDDYLIKRVRIDGPTVEDWFDLDLQRPLERALYAYAVKAFHLIDSPYPPAKGKQDTHDIH